MSTIFEWPAPNKNSSTSKPPKEKAQKCRHKLDEILGLVYLLKKKWQKLEYIENLNCTSV
jgi:hypothetical protein